jgi:hypothetical protein
MASAGFESSGKPISQVTSEFLWNGARSLAEAPGPKMAAARTSAADYQKRNPKDTKVWIILANGTEFRPNPVNNVEEVGAIIEKAVE